MISWKRRLHRLLFLVSYWETSDKALAFLQSRAAWLLPPLKEEILQYNSKIMCCLKKFQLPKTPSHPELESVAPCFKKKKIQSYKLPSFLSSSFPFHVSPARLEAEVGISIAFTSSTSPHISEQWFFFSLPDSSEPDLEPAEPSYSSALQGPDSSFKIILKLPTDFSGL